MTTIEDVTAAAQAYGTELVAAALTPLQLQLADAQTALTAAQSDEATDEATIATLTAQIVALQAALAAAQSPPSSTATPFSSKGKSGVLQLADQVVYEISDLLDGAWATGGYGAMLDAVTKLLGGDGTIMRMKPNSVTKAKAVINALIQGKGATNNYSVLRLGGHQVGFEWGNTRLEWTDQGALVNGALIYYSTKADIHDNEIIAFKGTASSPPGELFGMNDVHGDNNRYRGNAINGRGQGASGFGANSSKNPITIGGISENNPIAAGYTHYRTTGAEYHYSRSYGNKVGYNFEMGSGPVILDHVDLRGISGADFIFDHTDASAKIQIIEPSTDSADGSFDVLIHKNYIDAGIAYPVKQLQSDVTLIKNGVQRPDLLKFRTA